MIYKKYIDLFTLNCHLCVFLLKFGVFNDKYNKIRP
jgi:hypothetical protein